MVRFLRALMASGLLFASNAVSAAPVASLDDTARLLAGLQPSTDSPLAPLTREKSWQQHARSFDKAWKQLDQRQLVRIRTWSGINLTVTRPVLYYMFSGPDFLYANAFFPNAATYVLAGLEPVGQVPDLNQLSRGSFGREIGQLEVALGSIMSYSFFITHKMREQLNTGLVTGTLPILYVFLARSGKTIKDVSFVNIDGGGTLQPPNNVGKNGVSKGVKITFSGNDGKEQTLYYFSTDLSNSGVKTSGFLKFCSGLGEGDSFVKSASYLMHSDGFSVVRDFLLAHSLAIVQDDSGIPVRFLTKEWQLNPFGNYVGPIGMFAGLRQPKLNEVFRKYRSGPLDFGIGYRWHPQESNLLLAVKDNSVAVTPSAEEPAAPEPRPKSKADANTKTHAVRK